VEISEPKVLLENCDDEVSASNDVAAPAAPARSPSKFCRALAASCPLVCVALVVAVALELEDVAAFWARSC
jgi:hypothetical protein